MSAVDVTLHIAAPPADVWRIAMDPRRLGDWVTIHRKLHTADPWPPHEGSEMVQTLALRGTPFKVHWKLVACEDARLATWEGKGPARSRAQTEYRLAEATDGGTDFSYHNTFRAPLGPLGAVASRAVVGDLPVREAEASLERLRALCESPSQG